MNSRFENRKPIKTSTCILRLGLKFEPSKTHQKQTQGLKFDTQTEGLGTLNIYSKKHVDSHCHPYEKNTWDFSGYNFPNGPSILSRRFPPVPKPAFFKASRPTSRDNSPGKNILLLSDPFGGSIRVTNGRSWICLANVRKLHDFLQLVVVSFKQKCALFSESVFLFSKFGSWYFIKFYFDLTIIFQTKKPKESRYLRIRDFPYIIFLFWGWDWDRPSINPYILLGGKPGSLEKNEKLNELNESNFQSMASNLPGILLP